MARIEPRELFACDTDMLRGRDIKSDGEREDFANIEFGFRSSCE